MEVQPQEMDDFVSVYPEAPEWLRDALTAQGQPEFDEDDAVVPSLGFI